MWPCSAASASSARASATPHDHPDVELNNKQATACPQDNSAKGLIVIDDINLAVGILGLGVAENSETNSIECASSFAVGGE